MGNKQASLYFILFLLLIVSGLIACSSSSPEPDSNDGPVFVSPKDSDASADRTPGAELTETPSTAIAGEPDKDTPDATPSTDSIQPTTQANPGSVDRGFETFGELGCVSCHTVSGRADAIGQAGPNLDKIGDTAHVRVPGIDAEAYLRQSITNPGAFVVPGFANVMPPFDQLDGTPRLDELIAYLLTLSSPDREDYLGISDSLTGRSGNASGTTPEFGPAEAEWVSEPGTWSFSNSGLTESTGAAADNRLLVDSGLDHASYSVDIEWNGGLAGVVGRYSDSDNWIMIWYNSINAISIASHSEDGFIGYPGIKFDWGDAGKSHRLMISDYGDTIDVLVDGERIFSFDPGPILNSGRGGIFNRNHDANVFTNFSIAPSGERPAEIYEQYEISSAENPQVVIPVEPALEPKFIESNKNFRAQPGFRGSFVESGHILELIEDTGIAHPTAITYDNGALYIAAAQFADIDRGAVYALERLPDGNFGPPILVAVGLQRPTGILYAYDSIYATSRGAITRLTDTDGDFVADIAEEIVSGLPASNPDIPGELDVHQTQGLQLGADGRIYVFQGAVMDHGPLKYPLEGSVFSILADGSDLQVYAYGFRNTMDFDFHPRGDMFIIDNGPTFNEPNIHGELPSDELHLVRPGADHGFPDILGTAPPGSDVESPIHMWRPQIGPSGAEFYSGDAFPELTENDFLIARFNPGSIARIRIEFIDGVYEVTEEEELVGRFGTIPTDVTVSPNGEIFIADWGGGRIFRIRPKPTN